MDFTQRRERFLSASVQFLEKKLFAQKNFKSGLDRHDKLWYPVVTARLVKSNQGCGGSLQGPRKGSKFLHSILFFSGSVQLYGLLCMLRAAESAFGTALFAKARKQKRDTSLDHRCVPFFVLSSFPANPQQFLASIAVAPPVLLGYTVISVPPPHGQRAMYQRAVSQAAKGGFCYEISVSICADPRVLFFG